MRRELQGSAAAAIVILDLEVLASIVFNNNHGRSLSLHAAKLINAVHHDNYNACIMLCGISTEASTPAVLSSVQCFLCCLIIDFVKHYNFSVLSCVVGAGHDSVEQQALQPQASPGT